MFKEVLEDAIARGEKLKKDIVRQVLSSAVFSDLVNSKKFADTVSKIIQTKEEISRTVSRKIIDALKLMSIPSDEQVHAYEKRVRRLEAEIDRLGRQLMRQGLARRGNGNARPSRSKKRSKR